MIRRCCLLAGLILDGPQLVGGGDDKNASPFREWAIHVTAGDDATYFLCSRGGNELPSYL